MFNKVKENYIALVTQLNTADGNKTTNTRRLRINAASNRKTVLFQHRKQKKEKKRNQVHGTTRQCKQSEKVIFLGPVVQKQINLIKD